jgi:hypothetical protein
LFVFISSSFPTLLWILIKKEEKFPWKRDDGGGGGSRGALIRCGQPQTED